MPVDCRYDQALRFAAFYVDNRSVENEKKGESGVRVCRHCGLEGIRNNVPY